MSIAADPQTRTVALIGNPNTGKSTVFGALSGVQQRVGNYPGVTVEKKTGRMLVGDRRWTLIDLPGTYSLAPRSPDEMVAVDVLLGRRADTPGPDVVLCVVDANNLERNLYLVSQVLELGRPTVVALTMTDVAEDRGVAIDAQALRDRLGGVPVVPIRAHKRVGLDALKAALAEAAGRPSTPIESPFPEPFRAEVARLGGWLAGHRAGKPPLPRYLVERLLLDTGGYLEGVVTLDDGEGDLHAEILASRHRLAEAACPVPAVEAMARYGWAASTLEGVVTRPDQPRLTTGDRVDRVLTHRAWGTLIFVVIMALIFQGVFTWAVPAMDLIDAGVGRLAEGVEGAMAEGPLRSLIVDGVIAGVGGVIVFLPQIFILFFFLGILEDCGYLARAAYLMDRLMTRLGLSGKSFIPLLSSFACAIPGVMATRVIEDRRDRMTTILVAPLMSCSARLPVYTLLIAAFIPPVAIGGLLSLQAVTMVALYSVGVVAAAGVAWALKRTVFRGPTPPFVMELPAYTWPSARVVLHRMFDRGWSFVRRAGTIIVAVSVVMWALLYYPRLPELEANRVAQQVLAMELARDVADDPDAIADLDARIAAVEARADGLQKRNSLLGRAGRLIEPVVRPLGWDWRIGAAAIASFPAREVVVATLGVIFDIGSDVEGEEGVSRLQVALREAEWRDGRPLFTVPVALSIMVFFALCAQCVSTLAVIRRETNSWAWPAFSFAYMTALAYVAAMITYQVGTLLAA
ncbi:ferrous iron transport protein B [Tautonia plasticadhaerens]|uniref:Ferrous iron transport protein B n=1 Tax=Tautonia plasticadhaerens TaxID=2527974 RepID=A0A518GV35_9BACT|nr:ferrous iron transport protein B [Tautonia plasticadhaerens]QDV32455.1 Ferrous iron transport protein B [Tautonia plasticadhaerens]